MRTPTRFSNPSTCVSPATGTGPPKGARGRRAARTSQVPGATALLAVLAVLALVGTSCSDGGDDGPSFVALSSNQGELPDGDVTLVAEDLVWGSDEITVSAGTEFTIIVDHRDVGSEHNLVLFTEGIEPGATAEIADAPGQPQTGVERGPVQLALTTTIDDAGTYEYVCTIHPIGMRGTLIVE